MACLALLAALAVCASAAEWHVVNHNLATIDLGISFISATVGYTPGTLNGLGPEVFKSTDGGTTFTPCNITNLGFDIMLFAVDAAAESVVVSSEAGELYSVDGGKSFHQSIGGGYSMSVRHLGATGDGGHKYGCAGYYQLRYADGVAISVNSGRTFSVYDAKLFTSARYAAFPTTAVWYVAAGEFPQNSTQDDDTAADDDMPIIGGRPRPRGARAKSYVFNSKGGLAFTPGQTPLRAGNDTNGYAAQISKTTDGGITWKTVFAENGTFYFNGIDCNPQDQNHCCAVGEGFTDTSGQSNEPGARVHCTHDGGTTWNRTFWQPQSQTSALSLMELRFVSPTEIWAVGGNLGSIAKPAFLHSTDGGDTWTLDFPATLDPGSLAVALSFPSASVGYTVLLNTITQAASIGKYGL